MLPKGTSFIRRGHIWFTLTEPIKGNPDVLCVNLTTLDDECVDDECFITPSDYWWVEDNHRTVVAFSRARIWNATKIVETLKEGTLRKPREGDIPPATIVKIVKAALKSNQLSNDLKAML